MGKQASSEEMPLALSPISNLVPSKSWLLLTSAKSWEPTILACGTFAMPTKRTKEKTSSIPRINDQGWYKSPTITNHSHQSPSGRRFEMHQRSHLIHVLGLRSPTATVQNFATPQIFTIGSLMWMALLKTGN